MVKRRSKDIKCVVVGDGGVGKTSMLMAYTTGAFLSDYTPTVFDSFAVTMTIKDTEYNVGLYDTAGQETYDNLRSLVYYDTDIFIVCFSTIRPDSFENVRTRWIPELKFYKPKARLVLVGTQIDMRNNGDSSLDSSVQSADDGRLDRHITYRQGAKLSLKVGADGYFECSALTHDGLAMMFEKTAMSVVKPNRRLRLWRSVRCHLHF